jgi:hypothetical protein
MANELKIRVIFDTGEASVNVEKLAETVTQGAQKELAARTQVSAARNALIQQDLNLAMESLDKQTMALQTQSQKETAAIQKALGAMEQRDAKEQQMDIAKYSRRNQLIAQAEASSLKEVTAYQRLIPVIGGIRPAMDGMAHGSANAAMTLQALNYTVRDSPYFFRDFSLGVLAVGNNLNPLIDGFIRMRTEAGGTGGAIKMLTGMLTGPQGAIFAFSMIVTIFQAVTFAMAKNKSVTKELGEGLTALLGDVDKTRENVRKYREELEKIPLLQIPETTEQITEAMAKLIEKIDGNIVKAEEYRQTWYNTMALPVVGWVANVGMAIGKMFMDWDNKDNQKKLDLLTEGLKKLSGTSQDVAGIFSSFQKGTLAESLKSLPYGELEKLSSELGKLKKTLTADNKPGSIDFGQSWGWGTAKQLEDLKGRIDAIINPPKLKKEKVIEIDGQSPSSLMDMYEQLNSFRIRLEDELQEVRIKNIRDEQLQEEESFKLTIKKKKEEIEKLWKDLPLAEIEDYQKYQDALAGLSGEESAGMGRIGQKYRDKSDKANRKAFDDAVDEWMKNTRVLNDEMQTARGFANDIGTGLIQAFSSGANAIDSFLRSLEAAIAKMLVMLAIEQILGAIFGGVTLGAPALPGLQGGSFLGATKILGSMGSSNFQNLGMQKQLQAMNMNMQSAQPTILIKTDVSGLKFTKEVINPSQAKLIRGNVVNVI